MVAQKSSIKLLSTIINLRGVNAVTVVGRDGFVIESQSKSNIDIDALGAIVSTGFGASEVMSTEMNLGKIQQTMVECASGKVLIASCGDAILAVTTDTNAVIGSVRHNITKVLLDLENAL